MILNHIDEKSGNIIHMNKIKDLFSSRHLYCRGCIQRFNDVSIKRFTVGLPPYTV